MTIDAQGNTHQPAGTQGAGQFAHKLNSKPSATISDVGLDDDDDHLFDIELGDVGYSVHDSGDGYVAYASTGHALYFSTPSDDHGSVEDALVAALVGREGAR